MITNKVTTNANMKLNDEQTQRVNEFCHFKKFDISYKTNGFKKT